MADTSVPAPSFGPNGFVAPTEAAILAGVFADINAAFGGGLDPGLSTPQGQLSSTEAAIIGDANATFLWMVSQFDPAFNEGRQQDAIARIYFLTRNPALPTVVATTCGGLPNVVIPNGALARDTAGNLYVCQEQVTIAENGTVTASFANTMTGPIPCPAGTLTEIYQAIFGWDTITNTEAGALGNVVESRSDFEARRALSTAANSIGSLPSVLGAVLKVSGVLDAVAFDNNSASPEMVRGVTMAARSLYVCALGGTDAAVAFAIWTRKAPGCGYTGNTTETVTDPSPSYQPPPPSYEVTFQRPDLVSFTVVVAITDSATVPSTALTQVQTAIINAFAGVDGGPRATIGSLVYASRYYPPVALLGIWAQRIISIKLATPAQSNASILGAIASDTLTVTSVFSGRLEVGQLLTSGTGTGVIQGTTITALLSGTGNSGTYRVSQVQTISGTAGGYAPLLTYDLENDIQMDFDEAPTVSADGIMLQLL